MLDGRPGWSGGKFNATSVLLEPLNETESGELVRNLLGRAQLAADVRARLTEAAEGNPLFVEEMLAMLIDDGLLERSNGDWVSTGDLGAATVPPTIQALLSARLDRLGPVERAVIERASVEGKVFHRGAVIDLSTNEVRDEVGGHLQSLVRKELVRPNVADFPGEDAFKFRHLLIRDAAYDAMPKELRAELHERFAAWLEGVAGERVLEYEAILGFHLEQAYRYRAELAPIDEAALELAVRAAKRLASAGERASGRGDMAASASLLDRAYSLLPLEDPLRKKILPGLLDATIEGGQLARASDVVAEALDLARATDDRHLEMRAALAQVTLSLLTDPHHTFQSAIGVIQEALDVLAAAGDESGLSEAYVLLGKFETWLGRASSAEEAFAHAAEHGRLAGDRRAVSRSLGWLGVSFANGNSPASVAIDRLTEILDNTKDDRNAQATLLTCRALLFAIQGRFDEARRDLILGREIHQELGAMLDWAGTASNGANVYLVSGTPEAAEEMLEGAIEVLHEIGETGYTSTLQGQLAEALYAQGRYEEADEATRVTEHVAAPDDLDSQVRWRSVRAKLLARQGDTKEGEAMAREAVDLVEDTDFLDLYAEALRNLAEVLDVSARGEERTAVLQEALRVCEARENLVGAEQMRALLGQTS